MESAFVSSSRLGGQLRSLGPEFCSTCQPRGVMGMQTTGPGPQGPCPLGEGGPRSEAAPCAPRKSETRGRPDLAFVPANQGPPARSSPLFLSARHLLLSTQGPPATKPTHLTEPQGSRHTHTHRGGRPLGCGYVAVIVKPSSGRLENRRERDHSAARPGQRPLGFLLLCTPRPGADTAIIRKSAQSGFLLFFAPHPLLRVGFLPGTAPSPTVGHTTCSQRPCHLRASWV